MDNHSQTIHCILGIIKIDKDVRIIAEAKLYENIEQIKMAWTNRIISPYVITGKLMQKSITEDYESIFVQEILADRDNREMKEIEIKASSKLVGKTLLECEIHNPPGIVLLGIGKKIEKNDENINKLIIDPSKDYILSKRDVILGIGEKEEFEKLRKI